ncbi:uncharacterized protein LOC129791945 isoform X3 [Lutzomyia longipalpis]|uniref:uncharacterized protein LOC129791945 isoform X3 n=1 Tax=Lutzomyia longipalpis TaxID=7200 RepID=UPI002483D5DE|nr:uncharacterized protein LOC129791945 isoform X3 [Lutzomyia longipalpis]
MGTLMLIGVSALFVLTSAISVNAKDDASPMLDTIFCPFRPKPWDCTRQNVARMLSNWDEVLAMKLQEFKEEADAEYQAKLQSRDFTARDLPQEKPSAVMTTVEKTITSIAESVSERLEEFLRQPKSEDLEMEEKQIHKLDQRGKKKKKKKALMKLLLLGAIVKGKIELLLKLLSAHLQLKFLAIAAIGLLVNIARFWIDLKKGHSPQKHHYDDHGDDWNGGGGYWKRSIEPGSVTAETEVHELPYRYQRPTSVYHQPQAPPYLY